MKKLISILLLLTTVFSVAAVSVSADGMLYVQSDFTEMETFTQHFQAGRFYTEENILLGYNEAKALQSKGEWYKYDTSCEIAISEDPLTDGDRYFSVVYCNVNLENYGRHDGTYYMSFSYDVANKQVWLTGGGVSFDENEILAGPVSYEGVHDDGMNYNTFGISVSDKRIRCFIDDKLVIDFDDKDDEYLIGREDENTVPVPHVYWNDNNFVQIKDVKFASPGYLYPFDMTVDTENTDEGDVTTTSLPIITDDEDSAPADDNNNNGEENAQTRETSETTTRVESSVVINDDGETEIVTEIITESKNETVAPADTNTNKPVGGTSASTGDTTFAVVAAMVAAIGCALIVRKAHAE